MDKYIGFDIDDKHTEKLCNQSLGYGYNTGS